MYRAYSTIPSLLIMLIEVCIFIYEHAFTYCITYTGIRVPLPLHSIQPTKGGCVIIVHADRSIVVNCVYRLYVYMYISSSAFSCSLFHLYLDVYVFPFRNVCRFLDV